MYYSWMDDMEHVNNIFWYNDANKVKMKVLQYNCSTKYRKHTHQMSIPKLLTLRWMCGKIKDKIGNEKLRGYLGIPFLNDKIREMSNMV